MKVSNLMLIFSPLPEILSISSSGDQWSEFHKDKMRLVTLMNEVLSHIIVSMSVLKWCVVLGRDDQSQTSFNLTIC